MSPARRRATALVPVGVRTRFSYNGETVTVIDMCPADHGKDVLVEDRGGKRRYRLSTRELLREGRVLSVDDGPHSDDEIETAGVILANLSAEQLADVNEKAAQVREVTTGYRSGTAEVRQSWEPRAEYAPDLPLGVRYQAKAIEVGRDPRTVKRWVKLYREHGEAGLATLIRRKSGGRTDQRWLEVARDVMAENVDLSRPNMKSVMQQTNARLDAQYGPGVVQKPSRTTQYRRLGEEDRRTPTWTGSRARNRDVQSREDREYGKLIPSRPGEYIVMDTYCLDVFALDPVTLKWVSVEVTVAMDAYSRCIVGLRVAPTTKSLDVALTLFQAFRPSPAPPDWPPHAVWPEHGVPRAIFVDVDGLEGRSCSVCNPAIVPETIIIDHGKSFKNAHINSVCLRMGISIQPARLRTGQDKGILERFFLTLRLGLLQHLPGYKGPDVYSRGLSPETDAFLYIDELEHLIRRWIAGSYHLEPHDSLFDPYDSSHELSPVEMFEHGVERAGFIEAPRDPDLAFEFLVPVRRLIRHDGIQYKNRMYNGPGLDGLRGEESDYLGKAKRQWYIHVNPDDIVRAYFRHPVTRQWHTLYWTGAPALDLPMNEDGAKYARQLARARGTSDEPGAALAAMLDEWNLGFGLTAAERRIALRLSRQRASVVGDLTTADDVDAKAFVEAERAAFLASKTTAQQSTSADSTGEDDLDAFDDDEDSDLDEENYYAEAFENR